MTYKIMADVWSNDFSDYYSIEYDGVVYMNQIDAIMHCNMARIHECDNETIKDIYIVATEK